MTRARQNANISPAVGRNMIINGAMNVAQRSASVTGLGAASGYFTCDRWRISEGDASAGRFTMSQTADGPNGISANCIKLDCTTADTSIAAGESLSLQHRVEGQNLQRIGKGVTGAKQVTVSFYVKANAAFTFGCELLDVDNSRQITKLFATTTDWNRIELTFPADVDDGSSPFDDDNAQSLRLSFWLHSGATYTGGTLNTSSWANTTQANRAAGIDSFFSSTDNNFFLTGVQMEVGPVATDFEQEEISVTQNKCFRYFRKFGSDGDQNYIPVSEMGGTQDNYRTRANYLLSPVMRAIPSLSFSTLQVNVLRSSGGSNAVTSVALASNEAGAAGLSAFFHTAQISGQEAGQIAFARVSNSDSGYLFFDAEL